MFGLPVHVPSAYLFHFVPVTLTRRSHEPLDVCGGERVEQGLSSLFRGAFAILVVHGSQQTTHAVPLGKP